jgi:hypothetical protein
MAAHCYFRQSLDSPCGLPHFSLCTMALGAVLAPAQKDFLDMQRVRSLLRATPSRLGRRIARLVAIAAASLPDAGA